MSDVAKTWGDIYNEFLASTGIPEGKILDYRPCAELYYKECMQGPKIIVWLADGTELIYFSRKGENSK